MRASTVLLLLVLSFAFFGCTQKGEMAPPEVQETIGEEGLAPRNGDLDSFHISADILRENGTGARKGAALWILPKDMDGDTVPVSGALDLTFYNVRELRSLEAGVKEYVKGVPVYQRRIIVAPSYGEIVVEVPWEDVAAYSESRQNFGILSMEFKGNDGVELEQEYGDMYAVTSDIIWLRDPGYMRKVEVGRFGALKSYYHLVAYQLTKLVYGSDYLRTVSNATAERPMPAELEARLNATLTIVEKAQGSVDEGDLQKAISSYSSAEFELEELLEEEMSEKARSNMMHLSVFVVQRRLSYEKEVEAEAMLPQINASRKRCSEGDCEEYRTLITEYNSLQRGASGHLALSRDELEQIKGWEHLKLPRR